MASQPKVHSNKLLCFAMARPCSSTTTLFSAPGTGVPRRCRNFSLRKQPTVRLGGKKPRRGIFLVKLFRRVRLRLHYSSMLKKMKAYYQSVIKDGGAMANYSFQQRLIMETAFAVPVMGLSFNSFHPPPHFRPSPVKKFESPPAGSFRSAT